MSEGPVEWSRYPCRVQRVDQESRVANVPAIGATQEAVQLAVDPPPSPRRLLLEGPERAEVALRLEHRFDGGGADGANQLVLEVCNTHVEPQPFHVEAAEPRAEASPLQAAAEHVLLAHVTETGQPQVQPLGAKPSQEAAYRVCSADRHDQNTFVLEIATTARSEGLERDLVTDSFDEHDRA